MSNPSMRCALAIALFLTTVGWACVVATGPRLAQSERVLLRRTAAGVYLLGSTICHQRPDRSFHTDGVQWPVCARCAGLYLAAPVGVALALSPSRRRVRFAGRLKSVLVIATLPTALAALVEGLGLAAPSGLTRATAAAPLAVVVAWALAAATRGDLR